MSPRLIGTLLGVLGILALALALRMPDLDRYTTGDESRWVQRASDFWALVRQGDDRQTFIIGHPGVTTMWTALAGLGPDRAEQARFGARGTDVTHRPDYMESLAAARRAFALANSLIVVVLALLFWRLVGPGPGLVAGLLLAADPFLIAHSQLVHLDASLAGYMALSLVSAAVFWWAGGGVGYLLLSGVAAGLAFMTKAPALYLVGFIPVLAVAGVVSSGSWRDRRSLLRLGLGLAAWAVLAAAVGLLLWPALRADPIRTVRLMIWFASSTGSAGHDNFFLGEPTDEPGWLYYPVVVALRLGVGTLLGLAMLAVWGRHASDRRLVLLGLIAYVLGFWLVMSFGSKKFDRYLLPVFPILGLLAGLGWWAAYRSVGPKPRRWLGPAVAGLALATQLVPALAVRPYYLAYYNPLLGGGPVAARMVLVGWGEGLDLAGQYINSRPDGARARVGIDDPLRDNLQAVVQGAVVRRVGGASYLVDYISARQREQVPVPLGELEVVARPPEHSVWINGIEYARIYRFARAPEP